MQQMAVTPPELTLHTGDIIALMTSYGNCLRLHNGWLEASGSRLDDSGHFSVTVLPNRKIRLSASNGSYLSVVNRDGGDSIGTADIPSDGRADFTITTQADGQAGLMAANGKYLSLTYQDNNQGPVRPFKDSIDERSLFTVMPVFANQLLKPVFKTGDRVALRGVTSGVAHYWTWDANNEVVLKAPQGNPSGFIFATLPSGKITLQADSGNYLSVEENKVLAYRDRLKINSSCRFRLLELPGGKVALQGQNGMYLSTINYGGDNNRIQAVKATIDIFCVFEMIIPSAKPYAPTIALQGNRSINGYHGGPTETKYVGIVNRGEGTWLEAAKDEIDVFCRFTVTDLPDNQIALALGDKYLGRTEHTDLVNMQTIEATRDVIDQSCKFKIEPFADGSVAIRADNGSYLNVVTRQAERGIYTIEAVPGERDEGNIACKFNVIHLHDRDRTRAFQWSTIVLRASNGKYLNRTGAFGNTTIDESCYFRARTLDDGRIALSVNNYVLNESGRVVSGMKYLSRQGTNPLSPILANRTALDDSCKFALATSGSKIALQADNGNYLRQGSGGELEASHENIQEASLFEVLWVTPRVSGISMEMRRPMSIFDPGWSRNQVLWIDSAGALNTTYGDGSGQWQTETFVGEPMSARPALISRTGGSIRLLWNSQSGNVCNAWSEVPGISSSEKPISLHSTFTPAALSDGADSVDVFLCDSDFSLWHCVRNGSDWKIQQIEDGPVSSRPVAFRDPATGMKHVFWCNAKGRLKDTYWNGIGWLTEEIPAGELLFGKLVVSPSVIYNPVDQSVNLFWFNRESVLQHSSRLNGSWWTTEAIYTPAHLARPLTPPANNRVLPAGLKYVASDRRMYADSPVPANQAAPYSPGTLYNAADQSIHVFWLARDDNMKHIWRTTTGWQAPETIATGQIGRANSAPAPFFNTLQNRMEVFWGASDGNLYMTWPDGPAWKPGVKINPNR